MLSNSSFRLVLLFLMLPLLGYAQNNAINVKKFEKDEKNTLAIVEKVMDTKLNKPCALIIVRNVDAGGFIFDVGSNYSLVDEDEDKNGKLIKLWVSPSVKRISIYNSDKGITPLKNYSFNPPLEEGKVFKMELTSVFSTNNAGRQYVKFTISPADADAYLEVEKVPLPLTQGKAEKAYDFGTYSYRVTAADFHDEVGEFTINDPNQPLNLEIKLRHNYGYLTVKGDNLDNAVLYVDSKRYSLHDLTHMKLTSGQYTIKITKDLFQPYEQTFEIRDDQETVLTPSLDDDYSTVNISAPEGVTILIDGKTMGVGNVTTMLGKGKYIVEVRKQGYRSEQWQLNVDKIKQTYTKNFAALEPIYGTIDIQSMPSGALISIDGVTTNRTTPNSLSKILIGDHKITLTHSGYQPYETTVNVVENTVQKVSATLSNMVKLKLSYTPNDAKLQINGKDITTTPGSALIEVEPGRTIRVQLSKDGYHSQDKSYTMVGNKSENIDLKKIVYHRYNRWGREGGYSFESPRFFYISANYTLGGISSVGGCMGFQVQKFNMQFDGGYCLSSGLDVYEYTPSSYNNSGYRVESHDISPNYYYGGKIGLGFVLAFINFTPQIGYRHMDLCDTWVEQGTAGLRLQIRTSSKFAFIVNPEYYFPVMKGDLLKKANEELPETKKFSSGFQLGVGFDIYF